jgi:hypothetical protein
MIICLNSPEYGVLWLKYLHTMYGVAYEVLRTLVDFGHCLFAVAAGPVPY